MPNMADITVKKADGTTDAIYSKMVPSAGDSSPAIWRNNGVGTLVNQRPELTVIASSPQQGKRTVKMSVVWPLLKTVDGNPIISNYFTAVTTVKFSEDATPTEIKEAAYQAMNLHSAALIKEVCETGFAPT